MPASTSAFAVEGVKLKYKLTGKKRQRDSDNAGPDSGGRESDDENEGRGRAIKRKAKSDPFEGTHGKKKQKQKAKEKTVAPVAPSFPETFTEVVQTTHTATDEPVDPAAPAQSLLQSALLERKKKKKHRTQELDVLPTLSLPSSLKRQDAVASIPSSPASHKHHTESAYDKLNALLKSN